MTPSRVFQRGFISAIQHFIYKNFVLRHFRFIRDVAKSGFNWRKLRRDKFKGKILFINFFYHFNLNYLFYYLDICSSRNIVILILFCGWVLRLTNTVQVIWWLSSFTGGGRPRVPLRALFQSQVGTWVEPLTFRKLAG